MCFKLLQNEDKINRKIYVIWSKNQKYRVFRNLHRSYLDRIFRYEDIKDKYGEISQETIDIHLNSFLNCGTKLLNIRYQDIKIYYIRAHISLQKCKFY